MRAWTLAFMLLAIALAPVFLLMYYYSKNSSNHERPAASMSYDQQLMLGAEYELIACKVIDGDKFSLCLRNNKWIEGHLSSSAKDEAIGYVTECLNKATPPAPTVIVLRQSGKFWIVDLKITLDGKRVSMKELLASKGMLL